MTGRAGQGACCRSDACCLVQVPDGSQAVLDPATVDALRAALADERRSEAYYEAVMARHGNVRPFANIVRAEKNHENAVETIMRRHGLTVAMTAPTDVPVVASTLGGCARTAAQVERDNIALYDRLIQTVSERDVRDLFERLRDVSKKNHLPAFERWAST